MNGNIQPFGSDTDEEAPREGGARRPQRAATTARKTAILRTGLEPIMLGILSQFLLEAEGSRESEGLFE